MRGAIVGFGVIAMGHMVGYSRVDGLNIVAAVDPSPARRQHARQSFGIAAYADIDELMRRERIDFIDICTPPSTHGTYGALGLSRGLHVLCEKPVFMPALDGYADLIHHIRASDRVFYPCHVYKFAPVLKTMKRIISAPGFGTVLSADLRTLRRGHAVGVADWRPHWRRERELSGGGILRDHGPHSIYLTMELTGLTPRSVSGLTGCLRADRYPNTEDTALVRMRCDDGAEMTLTLTWASGYRSTTYSIVGESGFVAVDGDDLCHTVGGEVVRSVIESGFDDPSHKDWFGHMLADFQATVADPSRQVALIREALITAFAIEAAYESAADGGRWVTVADPADLLRPSRV
jgi:predicted dehydrogenase